MNWLYSFVKFWSRSFTSFRILYSFQYFEGRASSMAVSPLGVRLQPWFSHKGSLTNFAIAPPWQWSRHFGPSGWSSFFLIFSSNKKIVLSHTSFVFACLEKQWSLCFIIYVQCWHVFKAKPSYLQTLKACIVEWNVINKPRMLAYIASILPSLHINTRKLDRGHSGFFLLAPLLIVLP